MKLALVAAIGAVAAVPVAAGADAPRDRATGGGQVLLDPDNPPTTGALDTVAFQAQRARDPQSSSDATGQIQVNRRSGAEGDQVKFHGTIECLVVIGSKSSGEAFMSGESRSGEPFELYVTDGGTGQAERTDTTMLWYGDETSENEPDNDQTPKPFQMPPPEQEYCGIESDPEDQRATARGNNQVYSASGAAQQRSAASKSASTEQSTSLLSALR